MLPLDLVITAVQADTVTLCLDIDADRTCGSGDPAAVRADDGRWHISVPPGQTLAGLFLIAERSAAPTVLLAPASNGREVTALSTLAALQMMADATLDEAAALANIGNGSAITDHAPLAGVLLQALDFGASLHVEASPYATTADLGARLRPIVSRYIADGRLLPTVTARTIENELAAQFPGSGCRAVDLPVQAVITTENAAPVTSTEEYVKGTLSLPASGSSPAMKLSLQIKGRGNSTWAAPKKPYRIKLDKKAALLGMDNNKNWALLANYYDPTLLRNSLAFCLSTALGFEFTPQHRYVELTLNGQYLGLYQLTDHMEVATGRVDTGTAAASEADPLAGFFVEINFKETPTFVTPQQYVYVIKSDATATQAEAVRAFVTQAESRMFADDYADGQAPYRDWIDVETLVDFYLVNEFLKNNDAFYSSTYAFRKYGGKLVWGPIWDFDLAAGNTDFFGNGVAYPLNWYVNGTLDFWQFRYIRRLLQDPVFARHVAARWAYLSARLPAVQAYLDQASAALQDAQVRNDQAWPTSSAPDTGGYAARVVEMKAWLDTRAAWIDAQFSPAP